MAATKLASGVAAVVGGTLAAGSALAVDLPEDRAEVMYHLYDGGGTRASGPAVLVRKSMLDRVSLSAELLRGCGQHRLVRRRDDREPVQGNAQRDRARRRLPRARHADPRLGRGKPRAGLRREHLRRRPDAGHLRRHDDGRPRLHQGLGQGRPEGHRRLDRQGRPLAVPPGRDADPDPALGREREPRGDRRRRLPRQPVPARARGQRLRAREHAAHAHEPRAQARHDRRHHGRGRHQPRSSIRAEYRYFWDTWDIRASTAEVGYSRYLAPGWLADGFVRYYTQHARCSTATTLVDRDAPVHLAQPPALDVPRRRPGRARSPTRSRASPASTTST